MTAENHSPAALEAEQALLGVLLFDNGAFALMPHGLAGSHFGEPLHARLFDRIKTSLDSGDPADPILLATAFAADPAFDELGGMAYVGLLIDRAPPAANAHSYAKEVIRAATRRTLIEVGRELQARGQDGSESPDAMVADLERIVGDLHATGGALRLIDADEAIASVLDYIDNPAAHASGVSTGLEALDEHLGPLLPGDLVVLGGRTGMGKSAVGTVIGQNVALAGCGVIEINGEMSVDQVWRRRLTSKAFEIYAREAPPYSKIRKRTITYDERQMLDVAAARLRGIPLKTLKRTGLTVGRLRALAVHQRAQWERKGIPLSLVTVDHVGLLKTERDYQSRVDQQRAVSNGLKELADELGVPILALAQLNRGPEARDNKRPTLSDLRDSGSWEEDADIVIGMYRDAYYARHEKEPTQNTPAQRAEWAEWDQRRRSPWLEAILLKVREGETNTIKLWANMATNTVLGHAPDHDSGRFL